MCYEICWLICWSHIWKKVKGNGGLLVEIFKGDDDLLMVLSLFEMDLFALAVNCVLKLLVERVE